MIKKTIAYNSTFYGILAVIFFCASSCQEPIDLNLPEDKKLVVLSNFAQDENIKLHLGTTSNIGENQITYPADAELKLFRNGLLIEQLKYYPNPDNGTPFYKSEHIPVIGEEYTVSGNYQDYPEINASDFIPPAIEVENIELTSKQIYENFSDNYTYYISVTISFSEPAEIENYFHLKLKEDFDLYYLDGTDTIKQPVVENDIFFSLLDQDINHISLLHEPGILVDAKSLTTSNKLELNFAIYNLPNAYVKGNFPFQIRKGSFDYYSFHQSVGEQEITSSNSSIFSIPSTIVYNNIENGIGNFSGYSSNVVKIRLQ